MSDDQRNLSALPLRVRKKPVEVEAMQLTPENEEAIVDWLGSFFGRYGSVPGEIRIKTLEGAHTASPGDWVIKGVAGEFYPCKPDIFKQTYEVLS